MKVIYFALLVVQVYSSGNDHDFDCVSTKQSYDYDQCKDKCGDTTCVALKRSFNEHHCCPPCTAGFFNEHGVCKKCKSGRQTVNDQNEVVNFNATGCVKCPATFYDDDLDSSTACIFCDAGNEAKEHIAAESNDATFCTENRWQEAQCIGVTTDSNTFPTNINNQGNCTAEHIDFIGDFVPRWVEAHCPDEYGGNAADQENCIKQRCGVVSEKARYCVRCPDKTSNINSNTPCEPSFNLVFAVLNEDEE